MHAAWLLFCAFLAAYTALLAVRRPARQGKSLFPIAAVVCAAALFAARSYAWYASSYSRAEDATRLRSTLPQVGRPGGYVSSEKCRACHPDEYASWHATFHRTMTQFVSRETVLAPFDGEQLELEGQKFRLESRGDEFSIEMEDPEWHIEALAARSSKDRAPPAGRPERLTKRVGMVTGRHNMQVFWVPSRKGNSQISFPFTWIVAERRWAPLLSTFLRDPKAPFIYHTWNTSCIQCHTTNGQPLPGPEGSLATRTGEIGIGCECCHGPGDEHVRANQLPVRRYLLHESAQGGDSTIVNPKKLPGKLSSQVCGQCHGIKWIDNLEDWRQNGWRFRPGEELASSTPIIRATDLDDVARHLRVNVKLTELPRISSSRTATGPTAWCASRAEITAASSSRRAIRKGTSPASTATPCTRAHRSISSRAGRARTRRATPATRRTESVSRRIRTMRQRRAAASATTATCRTRRTGC
jgi:hypothetical protein